jgi:hypothetical protein
MKHLTTLLAAAALAACDGTPANPAGDFNTTARELLTLRAGETKVFAGIEIAFGGVSGDSRCPVDVVCVWSGNAVAEIGVGPNEGGAGPTVLLPLNTDLTPRDGTAWGLHVTLVALRPAPRSTRTIPPDGYEVDLRITAAPAPSRAP